MGEDQKLIQQLGEDDGRVIDELLAIQAGGELDDAAAAPAAVEQRTARVTAARKLLNLLDLYPVADPPADLGRRTLNRVTAEEQRRRFAHQISALAAAPPDERGRLQIGRWLEIAVGAAMIIVGLSLALPALSHNRAEARRIGCATNLGRASMGLGQYASEHHNRLPRLEGVKPGDVWLRVGQPGPQGQIQSNSAHVYVLVRRGYVDPSTLACPENAAATRNYDPTLIDWPNPTAPSYSYQNQHVPYQLRLDQIPHKPILADRNPLFVVRNGELVQNPQVAPTSPSRQHDQTGQNLLVADGSVRWRISPVLDDGDNIWTAHGIVRYTGTETPTSSDDAHLVP